MWFFIAVCLLILSLIVNIKLLNGLGFSSLVKKFQVVSELIMQVFKKYKK